MCPDRRAWTIKNLFFFGGHTVRCEAFWGLNFWGFVHATRCEKLFRFLKRRDKEVQSLQTGHKSKQLWRFNLANCNNGIPRALTMRTGRQPTRDAQNCLTLARFVVAFQRSTEKKLIKLRRPWPMMSGGFAFKMRFFFLEKKREASKWKAVSSLVRFMGSGII